MLGAQFHVSTLSVSKFNSIQRRNAKLCGLVPNSSSFHLPNQFLLRTNLRCCCRRKFILVSCKSSPSGNGSDAYDDHHHDYLEASLLLSDTITHYRMRKQGFQEDVRWQLSNKVFPFTLQPKNSRPNMGTLGHAFLRRFQSPTIFLKISCDGDFLLPIIVGEFAIEKLIDGLRGDDIRDCPDQFQLVRNVVKRLGYEVKMIKITERVVNTYFAKLYFSKPGEDDILSVDARPSDAINLATRCKAPIYVSKEIVFMDAIRIGYGMGREHDTKPNYDVSLDSAADEPDSLTEELDIVNNMNLAVKEERYSDAAMWRDKLTELLKSKQEH